MSSGERERYPIPAHEARAEIMVVNSRFIASAAPAFSVEQARAFIAQVKAEFGDASHNIPAFLIGYGASVTAHCTDDGEPSGTAGRPALAVLQGSGLGDVVMVAIEYSLFERARLLIEAHHGQILDQDFAADVTLTARFAVWSLPGFQADLGELTRGQVQA